jgi:hypothetical protein
MTILHFLFIGVKMQIWPDNYLKQEKEYTNQETLDWLSNKTEENRNKILQKRKDFELKFYATCDNKTFYRLLNQRYYPATGA